jgi:hypothetical protein
MMFGYSKQIIKLVCNVLQGHRLVLNAGTEYFQVLEKQGFVIGDCLRMPHDLQADVVLPIIKYALCFLTCIFYVMLMLRFASICSKYGI